MGELFHRFVRYKRASCVPAGCKPDTSTATFVKDYEEVPEKSAPFGYGAFNIDVDRTSQTLLLGDCRARCERDSRCGCFVFQRPSATNATGKCWKRPKCEKINLKHKMPQRLTFGLLSVLLFVHPQAANTQKMSQVLYKMPKLQIRLSGKTI